MEQNSFNISPLGYAEIKQNLINFLKTKPEFTDYDFAGSNLNVLVSALSYNAEYLTFFMNMIANEAFLDSAALRSNIVSHAKVLSYTPRSISSAKNFISGVVNVSGTPDSIVIPKNTAFTTRIDNRTYVFLSKDNKIVNRSNTNTYPFSNLEIVEGKLFTNTYNVTENNQKFLIEDSNVDTTTVSVEVQNSQTDLTSTTFTLVSNLVEVGPENPVYFISENVSGRFEVYFGDGIIGKAVLPGNIVKISYQSSSGPAANGSSIFSYSSTIPGIDGISSIVAVGKSVGGKERETNEEIRRNSVRFYESQNRLVTKNDYESYIKKNFSFVESAAVWRGEEHVPPTYGKVFISLKPFDNQFITNTLKEQIKNSLKTKNIVTTIPEIIDPEYTFVDLTAYVVITAGKSPLTNQQVADLIKQNIILFGNSELNRFNSNFSYTKLISTLFTSEKSISDISLDVNFYKEFSPKFNIPGNYVIQFNNEILEKSISSSNFQYDGRTSYFEDESGILYIKNNIIKEKIGIVNYSIGKIEIQSFLPSLLSNETYKIKVFSKTKFNDFKTFRNNIILIDYDTIKTESKYE